LLAEVLFGQFYAAYDVHRCATAQQCHSEWKKHLVGLLVATRVTSPHGLVVVIVVIVAVVFREYIFKIQEHVTFYVF